MEKRAAYGLTRYFYILHVNIVSIVNMINRLTARLLFGTVNSTGKYISQPKKEGARMNIKTLQRSAKRKGMNIKQEYDEELEEVVFTLFDSDENEIVQTNSKKYLYAYLEEGAAV